MSAVRCEVRSLALRPSGECLRHQTDGATTTPRLGLSFTRARSTWLPRSLYTRTRSPSAMPRGAASAECSSRLGSPSASRKRLRLANEELRKLRTGGERKLSGYFFARAGLLEGSSAGGV